MDVDDEVILNLKTPTSPEYSDNKGMTLHMVADQGADHFIDDHFIAFISSQIISSTIILSTVH